MNLRNLAYFNGRIVPLQKVAVNFYDVGLLRAYSVFEVMRTYNGKTFHLSDHLARLRRSAKDLNLRIPLSDKRIKLIINHLLIKNGFKKGREAGVRILLTGGATNDSVHYDVKTPSFIIVVEPFRPLPNACYTEGVAIPVYHFRRSRPEVKTVNYIEGVRVLNSPKHRESLEVLFIDGGNVYEACMSNFFIVKNKKLITAKDSIMYGITRAVLIKLANGKYKTEERLVKERELKTADEAFLVASNKDIVPVVKVGSTKIGNGKVGRVTKELMGIFNNYTSRY